MSRKKELTKKEREEKNLKKNLKYNKKSKCHIPKKKRASELKKLLKDFNVDDYTCPKYGVIKHKIK